MKNLYEIPLVSIGQEFRPECNVSIFARKVVDSIFRGFRDKWKILYKRNINKKNNTGKICMKMPLCSTSQEFWAGYNVGIFAQKHVDSIFSGQRKKSKILLKEKIIGINFVRKCSYFRLVKNLDQNKISPFLHENL